MSQHDLHPGTAPPAAPCAAPLRGVYTASRFPPLPDLLMRRLLPALYGTALALAMAPGLAAGSAPAPSGNIENGQLLAFTCAGCHGIAEFRNAYPNFRVPKIAGQNETYLVNALKAYRNGDRQHPTMVAQASSFSEQDIADLAAYFASRKPQQDRRP